MLASTVSILNSIFALLHHRAPVIRSDRRMISALRITNITAFILCDVEGHAALLFNPYLLCNLL